MLVGAVADLVVGLRRAHISADTAEPDQIDRRLEDGAINSCGVTWSPTPNSFCASGDSPMFLAVADRRRRPWR